MVCFNLSIFLSFLIHLYSLSRLYTIRMIMGVHTHAHTPTHTHTHTHTHNILSRVNPQLFDLNKNIHMCSIKTYFYQISIMNLPSFISLLLCYTIPTSILLLLSALSLFFVSIYLCLRSSILTTSQLCLPYLERPYYKVLL